MDRDTGHVPVRTCIGCRTRAPRTELLRVIARDGAIEADPQAIAPGRGAWLHIGCVSVAERRRAFARALRISGPIHLGALTEWIAGQESTTGS